MAGKCRYRAAWLAGPAFCSSSLFASRGFVPYCQLSLWKQFSFRLNYRTGRVTPFAAVCCRGMVALPGAVRWKDGSPGATLCLPPACLPVFCCRLISPRGASSYFYAAFARALLAVICYFWRRWTPRRRLLRLNIHRWLAACASREPRKKLCAMQATLLRAALRDLRACERNDAAAWLLAGRLPAAVGCAQPACSRERCCRFRAALGA